MKEEVEIVKFPLIQSSYKMNGLWENRGEHIKLSMNPWSQDQDLHMWETVQENIKIISWNSINPISGNIYFLFTVTPFFNEWEVVVMNNIF